MCQKLKFSKHLYYYLYCTIEEIEAHRVLVIWPRFRRYYEARYDAFNYITLLQFIMLGGMI